ncbi:MAG: hypothetical protein Q8936_00185 [Bacillota bacterium]|nr:hypothetical protein [Bacillota bacterium]
MYDEKGKKYEALRFEKGLSLDSTKYKWKKIGIKIDDKEIELFYDHSGIKNKIFRQYKYFVLNKKWYRIPCVGSQKLSLPNMLYTKKVN